MTDKYKVGQHFRSKKNKVLLTITKIDEEKNKSELQIADSDFLLDGNLSDLGGLLDDVEAILISEEEFQKYLKTYAEDIAEQQRKEEAAGRGER